MKLVTLGALAALIFAMPAYAQKEFDCPPSQEVKAQNNDVQMSEDLVQKRQQARDAEIARLKERFMRGSAVAQTTPEGPGTAR